MDNNFRGQIKNQLSLLETEDLIAIFQGHNTDDYEPETFDIVKEILIERFGNLKDVSVENILPQILAKIDAALEQRDFKLGLRECETAIRLAPNNAEAYNYRGLMFDNLGFPEKAIADYRQAVKLDPGFSDARENLDELLGETTAKVKSRISEISQNTGNNKTIETYIWQNFESMETDELVSIWQTNDTDVWTEQALHILQQILIERLDKVPDITFVPPLYKILDNIRRLRDERDYYTARIECERAVETAPDSVEAYLLLGQTLKDLGEWEKAIAAYSRVFQLDPEHQEALDELKFIERKLDERVKYSPAMKHLNLAMEYAEDGDYDLAIHEIEKARTTIPEVASVYSAFGEALIAVRLPDDALLAFEKAIQLNPDYSRARTGLRNAKVLRDDLLIQTNAPVDPAEIIEVDEQSNTFNEKEFLEQQDNFEETPGWVYMNRDSLIVQGSAGHRNRSGRSGLDPFDSQIDASRFEGSLFNRIFTGHFRTHDLIHLVVMTIIGATLSLPIIYLLGTIEKGVKDSFLIAILYSPVGLTGLAILLNVVLSIFSEAPDDINPRNKRFY